MAQIGEKKKIIQVPLPQPEQAPAPAEPVKEPVAP